MTEGFWFGFLIGMWFSIGLRDLGEYMRERRKRGHDS